MQVIRFSELFLLFALFAKKWKQTQICKPFIILQDCSTYGIWVCRLFVHRNMSYSAATKSVLEKLNLIKCIFSLPRRPKQFLCLLFVLFQLDWQKLMCQIWSFVLENQSTHPSLLSSTTTNRNDSLFLTAPHFHWSPWIWRACVNRFIMITTA